MEHAVASVLQAIILLEHRMGVELMNTGFAESEYTFIDLAPAKCIRYLTISEGENDDEGESGALYARVQAGVGSACGVGPGMAAASRTLGLVEQTLFNWVKAHREGRLKGADSRSKVTAEQMEISRLRSDLARATMERDILGKAMAYFAKGQK